MCQVVELSSVKCSSSFFGHSQMWWATSPIHLIANQPSFAKCYSFAKALKHYNYIHSTSQLFQGNARLLTIHFIHPQLGMWPIATEKLVVAKKTLSQLQQPPLLHLMAPWQHTYGIHTYLTAPNIKIFKYAKTWWWVLLQIILVVLLRHTPKWSMIGKNIRATNQWTDHICEVIPHQRRL